MIVLQVTGSVIWWTEEFSMNKMAGQCLQCHGNNWAGCVKGNSGTFWPYEIHKPNCPIEAKSIVAPSDPC